MAFEIEAKMKKLLIIDSNYNNLKEWVDMLLESTFVEAIKKLNELKP